MFFELRHLLGDCEKSLCSSRAFLGRHHWEQNKGLIVFSCVRCLCLGQLGEECKRSVTWIPVKVELDKWN